MSEEGAEAAAGISSVRIAASIPHLGTLAMTDTKINAESDQRPLGRLLLVFEKSLNTAFLKSTSYSIDPSSLPQNPNPLFTLP
jgi:hypothetical protein